MVIDPEITLFYSTDGLGSNLYQSAGGKNTKILQNGYKKMGWEPHGYTLVDGKTE